jgi:hypothetical protein
MNRGTSIRVQDIPKSEVGGIINCIMFLKAKVDGKGELISLKSRIIASKTERLSRTYPYPITAMTLLYINAV